MVTSNRKTEEENAMQYIWIRWTLFYNFSKNISST